MGAARCRRLGVLEVRESPAREKGVDVAEKPRHVVCSHPRVRKMVHDLQVGHREPPPLLDRDRVPLDLGWPINVGEPLVPQIEALFQLPEMGEFVEEIKVNVELCALAKIPL